MRLRTRHLIMRRHQWLHVHSGIVCFRFHVFSALLVMRDWLPIIHMMRHSSEV